MDDLQKQRPFRGSNEKFTTKIDISIIGTDIFVQCFLEREHSTYCQAVPSSNSLLSSSAKRFSLTKNILYKQTRYATVKYFLSGDSFESEFLMKINLHPTHLFKQVVPVCFGAGRISADW